MGRALLVLLVPVALVVAAVFLFLRVTAVLEVAADAAAHCDDDCCVDPALVNAARAIVAGERTRA